MATLTRKEMEQVIAAGGSVLYQGRTIWQAGQLPSEAELAKGDPEAETAAANALQQQIADLQQQIASLQAPAPASPPADPQAEKTKKKAAENPSEG